MPTAVLLGIVLGCGALLALVFVAIAQHRGAPMVPTSIEEEHASISAMPWGRISLLGVGLVPLFLWELGAAGQDAGSWLWGCVYMVLYGVAVLFVPWPDKL